MEMYDTMTDNKPAPPKKKRPTFVHLLAEAQKPQNWRTKPSSRFRWVAKEVYSDGMTGWARYYKSKILAETFAKSAFRVYVVGKVQGFL